VSAPIKPPHSPVHPKARTRPVARSRKVARSANSRRKRCLFQQPARLARR
jgi:hypothetical protein